jgi:geranylgeranyl pyrophosphate synthase
MPEVINQNLLAVELALKATADESERISPILAETIHADLSLTDGMLRGRSATTLLCEALKPHDQDAAIAIAISAELIHIANRMHKAVNLLPKENNLTHIYILAADFLFSKATLYISSTRNLRAMEIASRTLTRISEAGFENVIKGTRGIINWDNPLQDYIERTKNEIASVFAACGESGAVLAGLPEELVLVLSNYGLNLGLVQHIRHGIDFLDSKPEIIHEIQLNNEMGILLACLAEHFLTAGDRTNLQTMQAIIQQPSQEKLQGLLELLSTYGDQAIPLAEAICHNLNVLAKACIPCEAIRTEVGDAMFELVDLASTGHVV